MEADCDWAWLPRIYYVIRFSAVCTERRSVVVSNFGSRSLYQRQVPFLISRTGYTMGNLQSVTQKKMYKWRFPVTDNMKCCRCCGSSLGWLIMIDDTMEVILFNPSPATPLLFLPSEIWYLRNFVKLEMAFDLEDDDEIQGEEKAHEEEGDRYIWCLQILPSLNLVMKIGLTLTMKLVALIISFKTSPRVKGFRYFEDILYWKNLFYAVDGRGKLLTCDINTTLRVKLVDVPKGGFGINTISKQFGDLLWVSKFRFDFPTRKFCVCKIADNGGNVGWVKKEDLGDAAFDSIYFLDRRMRLTARSWLSIGRYRY
ncbi:hypothetical protein AAG906_016250 [Vitis piasezkii]